MRAVFLGSHRQSNGSTGAEFFSNSFSVDTPDGNVGTASLSTPEAMFPRTDEEIKAGEQGAVAESYAGHMFNVNKAKLIPSMDDETGLQIRDKSGRPCYNITRQVTGETITVKYLGPQAPKVSIVGLPGTEVQAPTEPAETKQS